MFGHLAWSKHLLDLNSVLVDLWLGSRHVHVINVLGGLQILLDLILRIKGQ